jgi:uncharacterized delta-60 repeat protein
MKRARLLALVVFVTFSLCGRDALSNPGDPDTSFGSSGRVRFQHTQSSSVTVNAAATMSDGRIVIAGQCVATTGNTSFCLSRINPDGSRDLAFDRAWHHTNDVGSSAIPYAIATDRQDRILVAGRCSFPATGVDMCVARFMPSGIVDTSFGRGAGFVSVAISPGGRPDEANAIALTADQKILLGGTCDMGGATGVDFCFARFSETGLPDTTFGIGGRVSHSFAGFGIDFLRALTLDWQGKIYAAGSCEQANTERYFCLMNVDENGSANFKRAYPMSSPAVIRSVQAIATTYDQKLILAGRCSGGSSTGVDFCSTRVELSSGNTDTSYGVNGTRITPIGYQALDDAAYSVLMQPDGRFVIGGTCGLNPSSSGDAFCFARYAPDGQEDRSIQSNTDGVGTVVTEFQSMSVTHDRGRIVLASANGGFVIVGHCERTANTSLFDICAAQYQGGPNLHTYCTSDIDGDGRFNALIDGLILSRVAIGMRDGAVMNGITPPTHALRRTWNNSGGIAAYLDRVCGINGLQYLSLSPV